MAGTLNRTTTPTYTLTVQARDGSGNTGTVTVEITVTEGATCSDGTAVPDPANNPGLVADCETLLEARDALRGTGSLNWSARTAITGWEGVTLGGTPGRVTEVGLPGSFLSGAIPAALARLSGLSVFNLSHNQLTGEIPAALGGLADLATLDVRSNSLSGSIPPELGGARQLERLWLQNNELTGTVPGELAQLTNLSVLFLTGNNLTGCIPSSLRGITLLRVGLPDCQGVLTSTPAGLAASVADGAFSLTWDALAGAGLYEVQQRLSGSGDDWAPLPTVTEAAATFTPDGGLVCETTHEFRVRARGNGMTHVASWTAFSAPVSQETGACNTPPTFDEAAYAFSVSEAAPTGHAVGAVTATDADEGDVLAYTITDGNADGAFAVGAGTGEITVAGDLDHDVASSYSLTVQADDGNGGTATAAVEITVADVLEERELWSGTMTAAQFMLGRAEAHGYTAGVTVPLFDTGAHGSLDDTTFVYGGETYTVQTATHFFALLETGRRSSFLLILDERRLPGDTTLAVLVDGHRLEGLQRTGFPTIDGTFYYYAGDVGFTLAADQEVALSLLKTNPSADSGLASLGLSQGALSPAFDPATHAYTATVPNGVSSVTVTAAANSAYGTVSVSSGGGRRRERRGGAAGGGRKHRHGDRHRREPHHHRLRHRHHQGGGITARPPREPQGGALADRADQQAHIQPIQFVPMRGSSILVGRRDQSQRIRDAVTDLQLAIDGCAVQPDDRLGDVAASLARHCSIFLRKMVLNDSHNRRLLDEDFCRTSGLRFDRIRRISGDRRTLTLVPVDSSGGLMHATKLNEETRQPEAVYGIPIGPQRLSIEVQWPLPGMVDWRSQPTPENPWKVRSEELFDPQSSPIPDCDAWLGQQLVMFDNRGITLKDVIRVIVNTEGAHSPPMGRLMLLQGDEDRARFRVIKDGEVHILSHIMVCGVSYSHAIVIEAAMYLYRQLNGNEAIHTPEGAGEILQLSLAPEAVFAASQDWLRFDGGLAMAPRRQRAIPITHDQASRVNVHPERHNRCTELRFPVRAAMPRGGTSTTTTSAGSDYR